MAGNSVLTHMQARGPGRSAISFAQGRDRLHVMPTSAGYEIATDASYRWNGRHRGRTPFSVVQCTLSGAGHLQYERHERVVGPGETMLVVVPHPHEYWIEDGRAMGVLLACDDRSGGVAAASRDSRGGGPGLQVAAGDDRASCRDQPRPSRREGGAGVRGLGARLRGDHGALRRRARRRRGNTVDARPDSTGARLRPHASPRAARSADRLPTSRGSAARTSLACSRAPRASRRRNMCSTSACGGRRACSSAARPRSSRCAATAASTIRIISPRRFARAMAPARPSFAPPACTPERRAATAEANHP